MTWIKKGILFNEHWAQLPVVDPYNNAPEPQMYKIYYSTRDEQGRSIPMTISCYKHNPKEYLHPIPVNIPLGKPGSFDSHGIMPSSIITLEDGTKYMYYVGWSKRIDVPYWNSTGLAISKDNGVTWKKYSEGPVLSTCINEPGFIGTVNVNKKENYFQMFFSSCWWEEIGGKLEPLYNIRQARSKDGVSWNIYNRHIVDISGEEGGIASFRPLDLNKNLLDTKFYYSLRNKSDYRTNIKNSYKIYSFDKGKEKLELEPSDNEIMCAYPFVIEEEDKYIMFYNSDFGSKGISFAYMYK